MTNKKAKMTGILAVVTAFLFVGYMITVAVMKIKPAHLGAVFFLFIVGAYGTVLVYASSGLFALIALILGIKMLTAQSYERLISLDKRFLVAVFLLMLFVGLGLAYIGILFSMSAVGLFPGIYTYVMVVAYIACLVVPVVNIIILKRMPEEPEKTDSE